jgi:tetratricopeptide (TPR) repeat protein
MDFYEAVQLFVQSARQARADFVLDDVTRPAVLEICRLVEGLPLGLELAAAWVRLLSCQEIAAEITRNLDFLATNRRDVPPRQRSLRAAFEHSWQLLSGGERQVLQRLAVFRRGFVRNAAEQVAQTSLGVLAALADKSLLRTLPPRGGVAQYELHELMRQFAAEKLAAQPDELASVKQRHAAYYLGLLAVAPDETCTLAAFNDYFEALVLDIEDTRAAWQWAVACEEVDLLERAESGLFRFYKRQAWFQEGKEMLGLAAQRLGDMARSAPLADQPRLLRLQAVLTGEQGVFCTYLGLHHKAQRLFQQSLALLREHGEPGDLAFMLTRSGLLSREMGRDVEARRLLEESVALARAIGDTPRLIKALHLYGYFLGELEEFPAAVACQEEALALARASDQEADLASVLNSYGFVRYMAGDYPGALELLEPSLAIREKLGGPHDLAVVLDNLGYVKSALGRTPEAQADFLGALRLAHATRAVTMANDIIVGLAGLLPLPEDGSRAVELLAYALHSPVSWRETKLRAERWLAQRATHLPTEITTAAEARGRASTYDEVVADLLGASPDDGAGIREDTPAASW